MNVIRRFVSWLNQVVNGGCSEVKKSRYQFLYKLDKDDNIVLSVVNNGNKVGEWHDGMLMSKSILMDLIGISIFDRFYKIEICDGIYLIDGKYWKKLYDIKNMPNVVSWNEFLNNVIGLLLSENEISVYILYTTNDHKDLYGLDRIKFLMKNPIFNYDPFKCKKGGE